SITTAVSVTSPAAATSGAPPGRPPGQRRTRGNHRWSARCHSRPTSRPGTAARPASPPAGRARPGTGRPPRHRRAPAARHGVPAARRRAAGSEPWTDHAPAPQTPQPTLLLTTGRGQAAPPPAPAQPPREARPSTCARPPPVYPLGLPDGPSTPPELAPRRRVGLSRIIVEIPMERPDATAALPHPAHHRPCPLRPAVRRVRPGPGADRGRVGEGDQREVSSQRRPGVPHPGTHHQGTARRAGQAPSVGAVDRLLQATTL